MIQYQTTRPKHDASANGLSAVRSMDGHFLGGTVRCCGGPVVVDDLNR